MVWNCRKTSYCSSCTYLYEWYNKTIEVSINRNAQNGRHCNGVGRFAYEHMSCPTEAHTGSTVPAPDDFTGA